MIIGLIGLGLLMALIAFSCVIVGARSEKSLVIPSPSYTIAVPPKKKSEGSESNES